MDDIIASPIPVPSWTIYKRYPIQGKCPAGEISTFYIDEIPEFKHFRVNGGPVGKSNNIVEITFEASMQDLTTRWTANYVDITRNFFGIDSFVHEEIDAIYDIPVSFNYLKIKCKVSNFDNTPVDLKFNIYLSQVPLFLTHDPKNYDVYLLSPKKKKTD